MFNGIVYEENDGQYLLSLDVLVFMNFWGFYFNVFEVIWQYFIEFVEVYWDQFCVEFYILFVINCLINEGKIDFIVIFNVECWYGVIYQEDKFMVQEVFVKLMVEGQYFKYLWKQFVFSNN